MFPLANVWHGSRRRVWTFRSGLNIATILQIFLTLIFITYVIFMFFTGKNSPFGISLRLNLRYSDHLPILVHPVSRPSVYWERLNRNNTDRSITNIYVCIMCSHVLYYLCASHQTRDFAVNDQFKSLPQINRSTINACIK